MHAILALSMSLMAGGTPADVEKTLAGDCVWLYMGQEFDNAKVIFARKDSTRKIIIGSEITYTEFGKKRHVVNQWEGDYSEPKVTDKGIVIVCRLTAETYTVNGKDPRIDPPKVKPVTVTVYLKKKADFSEFDMHFESADLKGFGWWRRGVKDEETLNNNVRRFLKYETKLDKNPFDQPNKEKKPVAKRPEARNEVDPFLNQTRWIARKGPYENAEYVGIFFHPKTDSEEPRIGIASYNIKRTPGAKPGTYAEKWDGETWHGYYNVEKTETELIVRADMYGRSKVKGLNEQGDFKPGSARIELRIEIPQKGIDDKTQELNVYFRSKEVPMIYSWKEGVKNAATVIKRGPPILKK